MSVVKNLVFFDRTLTFKIPIVKEELLMCNSHDAGEIKAV